MNKDIFLTNNLSNKKEKFVPIDEKNIGMYVEAHRGVGSKRARKAE